MKSFLYLFLVFFALEWQYYESVHGYFKVYLPESPTKNDQELDTDIGNIKIYSYSAVDKKKEKDEDIYVVTHTIYPEDFILTGADSTMEYICQTIKEGLLNQLQDSELIYSGKEKINGIESQIFLVKYESTNSIKTALIPFENHLYSLQQISTMEGRLNSNADKFFTSFKIDFSKK